MNTDILKLLENDARLTPEQIAKMEALCQERRDKVKALYDLAYEVCN